MQLKFLLFLIIGLAVSCMTTKKTIYVPVYENGEVVRYDTLTTVKSKKKDNNPKFR